MKRVKVVTVAGVAIDGELPDDEAATIVTWLKAPGPTEIPAILDSRFDNGRFLVQRSHVVWIEVTP